MAMKKDIDDISREEDFRDFEDRNVNEGWPYADQPGAASGPIDNDTYGRSDNAIERSRNPGFTISEAGTSGMPEAASDSLRPGTMGLENADDLEDRITNSLEALDEIDMDLIDVRAAGTTITVEGQVDDAVSARKILIAVKNTAGVGKVINHLRLAGVDSRIPDED